MILNSHHESFSKSVMFLRAFQKIPQNIQQKEKGGVDNAETSCFLHIMIFYWFLLHTIVTKHF